MRILLLTAMMIFASSASAGLYKWVDDEGNVHYSQKRPPSQQFERLKAPPPAPDSDDEPLYKPSTPPDTPNKTVAAETAKNEKIRAENCAQAKKNLSSYQIYRRVRGKDGIVVTLDDKVRATQIKRSKEAISSYCD